MSALIAFKGTMGFPAAVVYLCFILATVRATKVNLTSKWVPDIGWKVTCSWKLFSNDILQSVRLYHNDQQFLVFRPETDGNDTGLAFRRPQDMFIVHCAVSKDERTTGTCVLTMELFQPPADSFTFACEASGERPLFRMDKQSIEINAFVPPSKPVIVAGPANKESGRVTLNCSSSGLPAPELLWDFGDEWVIPGEFTGSFWNATSKMWHKWAVVSYTPSKKQTARCSPRSAVGDIPWFGKPTEYNSSSNVKGLISTIAAVSISLLLLR